MALPKLQASEYRLTLPSTQEEIKYRPFLVKEQKILMIAQESEEEKQIADAMATLISNCTFGVVNANTAPMFDVEYVFLQLRAKSAGAKVKLSITCPDDEETTVRVEIDLEEIAVQRSVEHAQKIDLTEDIKLNLRYPRLKDLQGLNKNFGEFEQSMIMVYECIESVISGEEIINRIDMSQDEITEFIDSFNTEQLENVMKFFETMPKLRHVVDVTNPNTKVKSEVLLEGIESFLE
tara:strand:+ start:661 stop:1368 length:708 start_codon:yes stop_codon:yes gene_type:complete